MPPICLPLASGKPRREPGEDELVRAVREAEKEKGGGITGSNPPPLLRPRLPTPSTRRVVVDERSKEQASGDGQALLFLDLAYDISVASLLQTSGRSKLGTAVICNYGEADSDEPLRSTVNRGIVRITLLVHPHRTDESDVVDTLGSIARRRCRSQWMGVAEQTG